VQTCSFTIDVEQEQLLEMMQDSSLETSSSAAAATSSTSVVLAEAEDGSPAKRAMHTAPQHQTSIGSGIR